jgi:hypothetical protein
LHSFPSADNEDAFSCSGRVRLLDDEEARAELGAVFVAERARLGVPLPAPDDALFEFLLDGCLLTRTAGHGDAEPVHSIWRDKEVSAFPG